MRLLATVLAIATFAVALLAAVAAAQSLYDDSGSAPPARYALTVLMPDKTVRTVYSDELPRAGDTVYLARLALTVRGVRWNSDASSVLQPAVLVVSYP